MTEWVPTVSHCLSRFQDQEVRICWIGDSPEKGKMEMCSVHCSFYPPCALCAPRLCGEIWKDVGDQAPEIG